MEAPARPRRWVRALAILAAVAVIGVLLYVALIASFLLNNRPCACTHLPPTPSPAAAIAVAAR